MGADNNKHGYSERSAMITLQIEVRRNRPSVTQGSATVYVNGEEAITFGDDIELIHPGEKYYGPLIGDWASRKPDASFIHGMLYHPYDELYRVSKNVRQIIDKACETEYPGTIRG